MVNADFDLMGYRKALDDRGLTVAAAQESSIKSRRQLTDITKSLCRLSTHLHHLVVKRFSKLHMQCSILFSDEPDDEPVDDKLAAMMKNTPTADGHHRECVWAANASFTKPSSSGRPVNLPVAMHGIQIY
jgi:tRNA A37 threonylcarbamoyladenosine dehydratase